MAHNLTMINENPMNRLFGKNMAMNNPIK